MVTIFDWSKVSPIDMGNIPDAVLGRYTLNKKDGDVYLELHGTPIAVFYMSLFRRVGFTVITLEVARDVIASIDRIANYLSIQEKRIWER